MARTALEQDRPLWVIDETSHRVLTCYRALFDNYNTWSSMGVPTTKTAGCEGIVNIKKIDWVALSAAFAEHEHQHPVTRSIHKNVRVRAYNATACGYSGARRRKDCSNSQDSDR